MDTESIPALNALLNSIATVLIISGLICIKKGNEKAHRYLMTTALAVSVCFLAGYIFHKWSVNWQNRSIGAEGFIRTAYLIMLLTHVLLAIAIVPLVLRVFYLAIKVRYEAHKRWARWTYPIWLYVSVTGVLVYFSIYVWFPPSTS
ncbi:MAG: DUF420 domain-containing protein [Opitutales bacterium]|nr:DUF420 domain-containing protein [Opitutales bacterium]